MKSNIKEYYSDKKFKIAVQNRLDKYLNTNLLERFLKKDHTIWNANPEEIANRLAWLDSPDTMIKEVSNINIFVQDILQAGFKKVILLGMGGSSLAPEVYKNSFGIKDGFLDLTVLDTTDPTAIDEITKTLELDTTLFIVSSKSGGTVETLSLFKYFYSLLKNNSSVEMPGNNFIAITDPGSFLERKSTDLKFKKIYLNDPDIGGRFSALSYFGLIPAALIGVNIMKILESAQDMKKEIFNGSQNTNPGLLLGTFLGEAYLQKKDKLILKITSEISSFGDWAEQLIAESTGKAGVGILPIIENLFEENKTYPDDHLMVSIGLGINVKINTKLPHLNIYIENKYDIGAQFFLWEFAISIVGEILNIQPFNQPNVESAKILAREVLENSKSSGKLPSIKSSNFNIVELHNFLEPIKSSDYISIQAYIPPTKANGDILNSLKIYLSHRYDKATTFGFGPRFLHSTGQLHKGDSGNGYFIQFISTSIIDLNIPDDFESKESSLTFSELKMSQAIGDANALLAAGRRVITFVINQNQIAELSTWSKEY